VGFDLAAPFGEHGEHLAGDPGDLDQPVAGGSPAHPEPLGQLPGQGGAKHGAGGVLTAVQAGGVQRRPPPVGAAGQVDDQHMGVQMGVPGAAGAMPEPRRHEPRPGQPPGPELVGAAARRSAVVGAATHVAGLALQPPDGLLDGPVVGGDHDRFDERVAEPVQHRHRLRRGEGQIEARHPVLEHRRWTAGRRLTGAGCQSGKHGTQLVTADAVAVQAEPGRGCTHPSSRHLAATGVVVLDTVGDLGQVVVLGADAQLPDRHHPDPEKDRPTAAPVPERHTTGARENQPCSTLVHRCGGEFGPAAGFVPSSHSPVSRLDGGTWRLSLRGFSRIVRRFGGGAGLSRVVRERRRPDGSSARERLRAVHERQAAALGHYVAIDAKTGRARAALAAFEADQRRALRDLATATSVEVAVELAGVSVGKVREALADQRRGESAAKNGHGAAAPVGGDAA
jgi:hypothetical protein